MKTRGRRQSSKSQLERSQKTLTVDTATLDFQLPDLRENEARCLGRPACGPVTGPARPERQPLPIFSKAQVRETFAKRSVIRFPLCLHISPCPFSGGISHMSQPDCKLLKRRAVSSIAHSQQGPGRERRVCVRNICGGSTLTRVCLPLMAFEGSPARIFVLFLLNIFPVKLISKVLAMKCIWLRVQSNDSKRN